MSRFGEDTARQVGITKIETRLATEQQNTSITNALPPAIGSQFGKRYKILGILGSGGMGTVLRAKDEQLGREVALKFPRPDITPAAANNFLREARALAQISHRNVCPVFDAGEIDNKLYISMALVKGQSLLHKITATSLSTQEAAQLTAKLCRALAHIHRAGLIHRDVKPPNVMIDAENEPVLMDFGLAQQTSSLATPSPTPPADNRQETSFRTSETGLCGGTLAYMSPEQVRGGKLDVRTDVYSTGVLLYRLLTDKLPVTGTADEMVRKITQSDFSSTTSVKADVPAALDRICQKAMRAKKESRFQNAGQMADALDRYVNLSLTTSERPPRWRWWAAASCILAIIGIGFLFTGEGRFQIQVAGPTDSVVVQVDGTKIDLKHEFADVTLSVGRHVIAVRGNGVAPETRHIMIRWRGDRRTVRFEPKPTIRSDGSVMAMCVSPDQETVFASVRQSDNIELVKSFRVNPPHDSCVMDIKRIPELVQDHPTHYKGLLAHGHYLYIVACYAPYVTRLDLRDNSQKTVNLFRGERPDLEHLFMSTIGLSPNGEKLVILGGMDSDPTFVANDRVYVINVKDDHFELQDILDLHDEPSCHSIAFTEDSQHFFVGTKAFRSSHPTLCKIQVSPTCEVVGSAEMPGGDLWGIAYSHSLNRVFVADTRVTRIRAFDGTSLAPQPQFDIRLDEWSGKHLSLHEPTHTLAVTVPNDGPILLANAATGRILERFPIQATPQCPLFSRDGRKLFVACGREPGGIAIFDLSKLACTVVFSSNHADGNFELYLMDANGRDVQRLTDNRASDLAPRFSPLGRYIAFISDRETAAAPERKDPHVWIYDCMTGESSPLLRTDPDCQTTDEGVALAWSPDGKSIAYINGLGDTIYVVNVDTGFSDPLIHVDDVIQLDEEFSGFDTIRGLSWEKETNSIHFSCRRKSNGAKHRIFQFDVVTRHIKSIDLASPDYPAHMSPVTSPLGNQLAVIRQADQTEIKTRHLAILDRGDLRTIAMANAGDGMAATPCYSPNGNFIFFTANVGSHRQIFRVDATGVAPQQITEFEGDSIHPDTIVGDILPAQENSADLEIQVGGTVTE